MWLTILLIIFILNICAIFYMIVVEGRRQEIVVTWTLVMAFLPALGFLLYILMGSGLSISTRKLIRRKQLASEDYGRFELSQDKNLHIPKVEPDNIEEVRELVSYIKTYNLGKVFFNNDIVIYTNGQDKLKHLKRDLLNAKHSINIEYFIFANDETGNEIMDILCQKASEGVKVKLIYDSVGSLKTKKRFFKKLIDAGGDVAEFFPPFMNIRLINLKMNYRNHKKVVIIDGLVGYTGGINIRDDHMGKSKKLRPWRDTHIRVTGRGVYGLQNAFLSDWRFCKKLKTDANTLMKEGYFPYQNTTGDVAMQILSSGPESEDQAIKNALIKAISLAKKRIVLQTPYFVPDVCFFEALKMAKRSGIEVIVMIPKIPDKKTVYLASLSYAKELVALGVKFYLYNGFLHAKTLLVDDFVVSIGSCNADNRSFSLNFELNTFLYGSVITKRYQDIVRQDLKNSELIDINFFKDKMFLSKLGQIIFRLFSPLL